MSVDKLSIYNAVRKPPANALKPITGGRLKGKTDINPMWRIQALTEQFGPCGIGWTYEVVDRRLQEGGNGEVAAFVDIDLRVKIGEEWSAAIPGTGGSMFVEIQKGQPYVSDECFKMALTDAISVACKALGFAADVYWDKGGGSKYDRPSVAEPVPDAPARKSPASKDDPISDAQRRRMFAISGGNKQLVRGVLASFGYESSGDVKRGEYDDICFEIEKARKEVEGEGSA